MTFFGQFLNHDGDFGDAQVVHIVDAPEQRASHVPTAASPAGDLRLILTAIADFTGVRAEHRDWVEALRAAEDLARSRDAAELVADTDPIRVPRVYGELRRVLDPDAVTIGDGGDFVSYAGKYLEPAVPGAWLDPGPFFRPPVVPPPRTRIRTSQIWRWKSSRYRSCIHMSCTDRKLSA